MSQYAWTNCSIVIRTQVNILLDALREILGENLVGIHLHGSLAMGCFNPDRSDLDLLIVTSYGMTVETKRRVVELLLHSSMAPSPIEISFLVEHEIHPFQHPLPFDLHYSESWREKYRRELSNGDWMKWNDETRKEVEPGGFAPCLKSSALSLCKH